MIEDIANSLSPLTTRVRTDVTARKDKNGNMVWTKQSLTHARLIAHLEDKVGRGVCPIREGDNRTSVAVLDFDSHKGEVPMSQMVKIALHIQEALLQDHIRPMAFTSSGGRGIHLIMIWDAPQDAYSVRQKIFRIIESCGYKNGTGGVAKKQIEVFPKQDEVPPGGYGNQFILPCFNKSRPLDLEGGYELEKKSLLQMEWPASMDVEVLERPVRKLTVKANIESDKLKKYADMVAAIDPDCDYHEWLRVGMALHFESDGGPDGLALWDEWSSTGAKYVSYEELEMKWNSFNDKESSVTGDSIVPLARTAGYVADIFEDFDTDVEIGSADVSDLVERSGSLDKHAGVPESDAGAFNAHRPSVVDRNDYIKFDRNKNGEIEPTVQNVQLALQHPFFCGIEIQYDTFRDEIMFCDVTKANWRPFADADYLRLRAMLERKNFKTISRELIRDAVAERADSNRFDTAHYWLENSVPEWDGTPRIDSFIVDYFGADDSAYHRAVGAYLWTAMAGRVLDPGCQADMVPILVGKQGIRKSTAVAALVPAQELFCEVSFAESDDDLARKMRGRLVAEIGELRGLHTKELEGIKAFITRRHENWVPKFKEFATTFPRRLVFVGTTNQTEFLADDTGNRRWLPVPVVLADVEAIQRDRAQLWAEARDRYLLEGVAWKDAERLSAAVHADYAITDVWEDSVLEYLHREELGGGVPTDKGYVTIREIIAHALNMDLKHVTRREELRIGKILKGLGFEKANMRIEGKQQKAWRYPSSRMLPISYPFKTEKGNADDLV